MAGTIPELFQSQAARLGGKRLFWVKRAGRYEPITWREALDEVNALSVYALVQGVNAGDRVILLSENRYEWVIADLAIQTVGAWSVPIYPSLTSEEVRELMKDCQPVGCIVSSGEQVEKILAACDPSTTIRFVVAMNPHQAQPSQSVVRWEEAIAQGRTQLARFEELLAHRVARLRPEDVATIIYTSGTTGEPKGVVLSHQNFLSNCEACLEILPVSDTDQHLSFLPLSHVFERMGGCYLMMMSGASVAYAESMDTIPHNMLETQPTVMLGVPRFFEKLYARIHEGINQAPPLKRALARWTLRVGQQTARFRLAHRSIPVWLRIERALAEVLVFRKLKRRLGGRLRFFVSGSAPLAKEIGEFFYSAGIVILEGYGLTETSPVITVNRLDDVTFGSVGHPITGVEVRIAEDGEILTRGPHVMQGYYQKPEATAAVLRDGWFQTGDIGHLDAAGRLYITDRKKDLIKTAGGKFVAPQKLENLFALDPYIAQAFVYGDRERYCVALIVPNFDQLGCYAKERQIPFTGRADLVRDQRIRDFLWSRVEAAQSHLARFEQVKAIALLEQEFSQAGGELTPTLKAKRVLIAQRYQDLLRSLYTSGQP